MNRYPLRGVATLILVGLLSGCRISPAQRPATDEEAPEVVLTHAHASPNALGRAVLTALREGDRDGLRALRVTRDEWRELFWPELPESDDTPFDFAWQMKDDNSRVAEASALEEFGGRQFDLLELSFTEPPEVYDGFTLHFGARLRARRVSDGEVGVIPILGVVVERQGLWKLSNLVD